MVPLEIVGWRMKATSAAIPRGPVAFEPVGLDGSGRELGTRFKYDI